MKVFTVPGVSYFSCNLSNLCGNGDDGVSDSGSGWGWC